MNLTAMHKVVERDGIVFLTYGGFLSQSLISGMTEALEKEAQSHDLGMGQANNIFTIFIELSQNMMKYTTQQQQISQQSSGLIVVGKSDVNCYFILSQNIVSCADVLPMQEKLESITKLDKAGLKERYRQLRRSGRDRHAKGAGIGFYEIAKRSSGIAFDFKPQCQDSTFFTFKASVGLSA